MITLITHWILGYPIFGDIRTNPSKPPHQEDATWLETSVTSNSTLQPRQQILSARRCEGACLPLQKWSVLLCVATDQPGGDRPIVTKRGWEIWEPREFGPGDAFFCSPAWFGCICVTNHVQSLGSKLEPWSHRVHTRPKTHGAWFGPPSHSWILPFQAENILAHFQSIATAPSGKDSAGGYWLLARHSWPLQWRFHHWDFVSGI